MGRLRPRPPRRRRPRRADVGRPVLHVVVRPHLPAPISTRGRACVHHGASRSWPGTPRPSPPPTGRASPCSPSPTTTQPRSTRTTCSRPAAPSRTGPSGSSSTRRRRARPSRRTPTCTGRRPRRAPKLDLRGLDRGAGRRACRPDDQLPLVGAGAERPRRARRGSSPGSSGSRRCRAEPGSSASGTGRSPRRPPGRRGVDVIRWIASKAANAERVSRGGSPVRTSTMTNPRVWEARVRPRLLRGGGRHPPAGPAPLISGPNTERRSAGSARRCTPPSPARQAWTTPGSGAAADVAELVALLAGHGIGAEAALEEGEGRLARAGTSRATVFGSAPSTIRRRA